MLLKKIGAVVAAGVFLVVLLAGTVTVYAQQEPTRQIAVVYDDSGSMIFDDDDVYQENWYRAKYAMEVFAAMLGRQDTMTVFPMSFYRSSVEGSSPPITLQGGQDAAARVETIHTMNQEYRNTPFNAVRAACNFLQQQPAQTERWLVILTDGAFEGAPAEGAQSFLLRQAREQGIKVVYLAMGAAASSFESDPDAGFYCYKAADSQAILSAVTQVANQVFSRRALPAGRVEQQSDTVVLDLDVPVKELILFVQGEGVAVGSLTSADGANAWTAASKTGVKYSELIPPNYDTEERRQHIFFDDSLQGVLVDFIPETPIEAGQYKVTVSGASQVEVYYTPYVSATLWLTDTNGNVMPLSADGTADLYSGHYTAELCLVDPLTGEKIDSELVQLLSAQVEMTNNGEPVELGDLSGGSVELVLEKGSIEGSVDAQLDGYQSVTTEFSGEVAPALWDAQLEPVLPQETGNAHYQVNGLKEAQPILVRVTETDPDTGESGPMSQADWENASFTVEEGEWGDLPMPWWQKPLYWLYDLVYCRGEKEMEWQVQRGQEVSTFWVVPVGGADARHTRWGEAALELQLVSRGEDHSTAATAACFVRVAPLPLWMILPGLTPVFAALGALLVVLVLWRRKKRLPRGLAPELHVHNYSIGSLAGREVDVKVSLKRKFSLFRPETATLNFSLSGTLSVPVMQLRAADRTGKDSARRFYIVNLQDYAKNSKIQPFTVNTAMVAEGDEKKPLRVNCQIACKGNVYKGRGRAPDCTLNMRYERNKGGLFGLGKKKGARRKRRKR